MGVDVTHLVLEALGDTDDQVVDERPDGAEGSDVLAVAMVNLHANQALLQNGEVDGDVAKVLDELATGALDRDDSRLDGNLDCRATASSALKPVYGVFFDWRRQKNRRKAPRLWPFLQAESHPSVATVFMFVPLRAYPRPFEELSPSPVFSTVKMPGFQLTANLPFSGTSKVSSLWM